MNKIKVKDSGSLYRDEESGAILNCSDSEYNSYLKLKEKKMKEVSEMDKLKDDVDELKDMMKLILSKLDK
jgi:hypothetical protein|tara:strand:- start:369 stop:578 length:210 start_codon:yes stop_codon:yes gene_type:complete